MRVLVLNWRDLHHPGAGGAETHVWKTFQRAAADGWEVHIISSGFPGAKRCECVGGLQVSRTGNDFTYNLTLPFAYRKTARHFKPDLVVEFINKLPLFSPLYAREPVVSCVHHLFGDAAPLELPWALARLVKGAEGLIPLVYRTTPFLTISQSTTDDLVCRGIQSSRIAAVPLGTDTARYSPGPKSLEPSILYLGRLKRYKGVDHLLRATPELLAQFPTLRVDIVGEGDALKELQQLTRTLKLDDHVAFHGFLDDEELDYRQLYRQAWVHCFPSIKEGFGLTVVEAALCGTPTVGYDVPGLRDSIAHNETGLLVPYGDRAGLRDALAAVLRDEALRSRLSNNACARYQDYTWERAAHKTLDVLSSLYQEPAPASAVASIPEPYPTQKL